MKRQMMIVGMMMLMVMSIASAEIVDDFNRADGNLLGTQNNLGCSYTGDPIGGPTPTNYAIVSGEMIYTGGSDDDMYVECPTLDVDVGEAISFDATISGMECGIHIYFGSSRIEVYAQEDFGILAASMTNVETIFLVPEGTYSATQHNFKLLFVNPNTVEYYLDDNLIATESFTSSATNEDLDEYRLLDGGGMDCGLVLDNFEIVSSNTEPVINSISPSTRIELKNGECQTYSANVTDDEDDASYNWTLGGIQVSTSETYEACWDDIAAGIYTLQLEVSDAEYSDTASTTLEIRARGGSSSGGTGAVVVDVEEPVVEEDEGKIQPQQQSFLERIADYFVGLWQRVFK